MAIKSRYKLQNTNKTVFKHFKIYLNILKKFLKN